MGLKQESTLGVDDLHLGHWEVRVSGPHAYLTSLGRVLHSLALPENDLPSLLVTIAPDGSYATGATRGTRLWSVELRREGWLSILSGQVVATAAALLKRFLYIHAGAVALDGRGWVIVGESGAGKTSTVAALLQRGATYLSDEIALLDPATRALYPFVIPMAVKSWTEKAAGGLPEGHEVAREGGIRFLLPTRLTGAAVPVETFVLLKPTRARARCTPISRADMLLSIAHHSSSFGIRHRCEDAFAGFGRLLQITRCFALESSAPASAVDRLKVPVFTTSATRP